jgi:hypothetical protein
LLVRDAGTARRGRSLLALLGLDWRRAMSPREPDWIARAGMVRDLPEHALGPARLLRALLRRGLSVEAVPYALRLVVELDSMAAEEHERGVAA